MGGCLDERTVIASGRLDTQVERSAGSFLGMLTWALGTQAQQLLLAPTTLVEPAQAPVLLQQLLIPCLPGFPIHQLFYISLLCALG